jgi:hypothetical protein
MRVIQAQSTDIDTTDALAEILEQARERLAGDRPGAALLFAGQDYVHQEVLDGIAAEWPGLPLIGCTTDGEVSSEKGYTEDSLLLVLFVGVSGQVGVGSTLSVAPEAAVKAACEGLSGQLAITLPASLDTNLGPVVRRLREALDCPLVGGASGDHRRFELIRQFAGTQVYEDALPVLTLRGDVEVGLGLGCGWEPIGTTYTVTGVEGHVLTQLDGKPVLQMLPSHAAMSRAELGEHPLAVFPPGESSFFLRPIFAVDLEAGVLAFAAEIPMGSRVRLTRVVREGILQGADEAAQAATQALPKAKAALVFTCAARKWLMGTRIEQEVEHLRTIGVPFAGFYGFAEIGPLGGGTGVHNQTCVVVALS